MIRQRLRASSWPLALVIFALSGCAGLIYQSIWAQYLGLFLGHAAYAQSLVLAIFMGGMAIGAWWISVRGAHWRNLLRAYAWAELLIGFAAAVFHPTFLATTDFAYNIALPALADGWGAQLFKWGSGALLILPQSILLGATFPLFSNGFMRLAPVGNGAILSNLYFVNSIGAASGALLATFVLLPSVGLPGAMRFGALLNIVVAITAFLLGRAEVSALPSGPARSATVRPAGETLLLAAAFVTGLTSFVYEIGWVRMLSLVLGSTVHSFELMLAAFIGGLAFGGLWIRGRIDAFTQLIRVAGIVQVLMGLAALGSLMVYDHAFDWVAWFIGALSKTPEGYVLFNAVTASTAILVMAPAAFFAGMTLPLFTLALIRTGRGEASVGRIYSSNTIGAIVGVFVAVHLLVPMLGLKLTMAAAAAGDLVLGLVLLRSVLEPAWSRRYLATAAISGAALAAVLLLARFDPMAMSGGVYRSGRARMPAQNTRILFYRDGKTASVGSFAVDDGTTIIATNGKVDASIQMVPGRAPSHDEITMVMAAALPLAAHPNPRTAAVIGFGSGLSTHTLLSDPRLERVDTIEIEPAMYAGARVFGKHVERAFADSRSHMHFDDAKTYFASSQTKYDIILSEPSNPWVSGVANLFSREFYQFVPRHLGQDGLFVQWIQQYEITSELIATVIRSLSESFADFQIFLTSNSDMLILAKPHGHVAASNGSIFQQPDLRLLLERVGLRSVADLQAHQIGSRDSVLPLVAVLSKRSNSDFFPVLSLEAPRARFENLSARDMIELSVADLPMREILAGIAPGDPELVTVNPAFSATILTRDAVEISAMLRNGAQLPAVHESATRGAAEIVRAVIGQCQSGDEAVQIDALILLAGRTIPFLGPESLTGVWTKPRWLACTTQPHSVRATLAVLDGLARRDFDLVGNSAIGLLGEHKQILSASARDWLLRTAMLAAIARHDYGAVRSIDASVGKDILPNAKTEMQRTYLLAFADAQLSH